MSLLQVLKFHGKTGDTMADKNYLHTAYDYSADGTDGFTTVYPNLNLLTGTSNRTFTGTNAQGYLSNETTNDFLTLFKELEGQIVTVSIDYEYSDFIAGSGQNRLGWETQIDTDSQTWLGPWYYPNNDSGSGRMSATFVVPKNIRDIDGNRGYIQFSGSGTGVLSRLKIEKDSVATPHMPSASEVKTADWPKYVGTYVDTNPTSSTEPSKYNWDEMKYRVYLDGVPVGGSKLLSFDLGNLKAGTSYNVQVSQINGNIESDKSESVAFKTTLTQ